MILKDDNFIYDLNYINDNSYTKNFGRPNQVWTGNGVRSLFDTNIEMSIREEKCAFSDLDSDGDVDIFVTHYHTGSSSIRFNQKIEN